MLNENLLFIETYRQANPYKVELIFFTSYIILTSFSLPVAFVLGLLSGMIFDNTMAIILVSFASSLGATFAFLISRYFFRDFIKNKYNRQYQIVNDGIKPVEVWIWIVLFVDKSVDIVPFVWCMTLP